MPKSPVPSPSRKLAQGALMLAVAALQDERVRAQLRKAPEALKSEAFRLERFDPTRRFGHKGIERRLEAVRRHVDDVFPDRHDATGATIRRAVAELTRAAAISETMPSSERRRARSRITGELTRLEVALVDAVLPAAQ
jgi:hypothetical protein